MISAYCVSSADQMKSDPFIVPPRGARCVGVLNPAVVITCAKLMDGSPGLARQRQATGEQTLEALARRRVKPSDDASAYGSGLPRTSAARSILTSTPIPVSAPTWVCSRGNSLSKIALWIGPLSCSAAVP